jgi:purine-cytosine permease-like protein
MNISCFSTGFLGRQFGLSLGETIPIVMFSTLLGAMVTVRVSSLSFAFLVF